MYITLGVILLVATWAISALSQLGTSADNVSPVKPAQFDRMKRRMELRQEMHRRILDKLVNGVGPDQDLFKDLEQDFEDSMSDSFSDFDQISGTSASNFTSEWLKTKSGRTLVLTPKDPEQKINIDVNATQITVKGEVFHKTANSTYSSTFSNSFPVPDDCDGTKVKMNSKDGKLLVELPYKTHQAAQPKPSNIHIDGEVQI